MNRNIWLISDTHFNHTNVLTFKDHNDQLFRTFSSTEEMNELMIDNWNSVVKDNDYVYHLGDVVFGSRQWMHDNWSRLKGSKRLVVGNHDDIKFLSTEGFFKKVLMWRYFSEFNLLLTHVPVHASCLKENMINVHGHTHTRNVEGPYKCVCVEQINYTPINIEEIRDAA